MVKLVIFDVDGTLVDSQNIIVEAQRRTFRAHGLAAPSRERSLSIVGLSLPEAFTALVGADGPVEALVDTYKQVFGDLRHDPDYAEPMFPGAAQTLSRLRRRPDTHLAIATGKSRRGVAHLIARHGFEDLFASIQTADDAPSKPHPGMILQAMTEVGAQPQETVMIGDSTYDMIMTRAADAIPLGVSWGYHAPERLREAGAAAILADFRELIPTLEEGFPPRR